MGCFFEMMKKFNKYIDDFLNPKNNAKHFIGQKTKRNNFDNPKKCNNKMEKKIIIKEPEHICLNIDENIYKEKNLYNKEDNENLDITVKEKKQTHNTVGTNIINFLSKKIGSYSYKLISKIQSFEFKKGEKNEEYFTITLKNDGQNKWIENESYLRCILNKCPGVIIDDIKLEPLDIDEMGSFQIKFRNLEQCPKGKYEVAFNVVINNNIIKDNDNSDFILIHVNVI